MDISSMLSNGAQRTADEQDDRGHVHQHSSRQNANAADQGGFAKPYPPTSSRSLRSSGMGAAGSGYPSPAQKDKKHVVFQLIDPQDPRIQARLPMRVMISPHDTAESIITTIKNFYGLYEYGVSFENKDGIGIIAAYDNFEHDLTTYVRTVALPPATPGDAARDAPHDSASPHKPLLGAPFEMRPSLLNHGNSPSRPAARSAGVRSLSPQSDGERRGGSAAPSGKPRPQRTKSKDNSTYGDADGYSSGDNGGGSVASSRRSKAEVVNAEISVDNIVEGGRRKRAFESSELPLFVPPQVPMSASMSSVSPQRRVGPQHAGSPYAYGNQTTFSYLQPLPSPQSFGSGANHFHASTSSNGFSSSYQQPNRQLRGRPAVPSSGRPSANGVLPTPDPTVGSAISDEDVALQLMRLGDPLAFSHGRTSTSTVDDALSGKADAASSDEDGIDDEDEEMDRLLSSGPHHIKMEPGPQRKRQRLMNEPPSDGVSGGEDEDMKDETFAGSEDAGYDHHGQKRAKVNSKARMPGAPGAGSGAVHHKHSKPHAISLAKLKTKSLPGPSKAATSPSSATGAVPSRKGSSASTLNFQHQLGADEEDLSSKPRCQRCRKSKKGCDRQRPCGRCKDAGIGIEGCISEDEGNGRKGRYGRHMGVPVKKADEVSGPEAASPPQHAGMAANGGGFFLAPALPATDKNKKRKR